MDFLIPKYHASLSILGMRELEGELCDLSYAEGAAVLPGAA